MIDIHCKHPRIKDDTKGCGSFLGTVSEYGYVKFRRCKDCKNETTFYKFDIDSIHELEEYGASLTKKLQEDNK